MYSYDEIETFIKPLVYKALIQGYDVCGTPGKQPQISFALGADMTVTVLKALPELTPEQLFEWLGEWFVCEHRIEHRNKCADTMLKALKTTLEKLKG